MKQNERHVKARHPDRCKEVEDVWKNKELIKAQEDGIELRDNVIRKQAIEIEKKHDQIVKQGSILQFQDKKIEDDGRSGRHSFMVH